MLLLFATELFAADSVVSKKSLTDKVCNLLDIDPAFEVGSTQFNETVLANLRRTGGIGLIFEKIAKKSADADIVTEVVFAYPYVTFFWNETGVDLWRTISLQVGFDRNWKAADVRSALKSRPPPAIDLPLETKAKSGMIRGHR